MKRDFEILAGFSVENDLSSENIIKRITREFDHSIDDIKIQYSSCCEIEPKPEKTQADEQISSVIGCERFDVKPFLNMVEENNEMINWFNTKMMICDNDMGKVRNKWSREYRDMKILKDGLYGIFNDMTELLNKNSEMIKDIINAHCR